MYRLVSIGGIEELIYRRQMHKKGMNLQTIEGDKDVDEKGEELSDDKAFQKYFNDSDLFRLFVFEPDADNCATLKLIQDQVGFPYERTQTNIRHVNYLCD